MAYQRIRIKNTNVAGKTPTAGQLDTAELCINLKDKKLFSKDADGNIFEFESGSSTGVGPIPPGSGNETGDLWWDGNLLLVWNGTDWEQVAPVTSVNGEEGDVVLGLGDINDVTLTNLQNSDIIAWNGTAWVNTAAPPTDISGNSLNDLNDVNTGTPTDGDLLMWVDAAGEWQTINISSFPSKTSDLINDGEDGINPFITDAGVTKIVAGSNVTIDPVEGTGEVTINAADAPEAPVTSVNGEVGDVVLDLGDLDDVTLTNLQNADVIAWNGNAWVNTAAPPTDISGNSIGDLNDVDITGVADGNILVWDDNAGEWKPEAPSTPDGQFVKLDDEGTEQSIIGGGGIDILGGITSEFGTSSAQLGNIAPLNDWSVYPARA